MGADANSTQILPRKSIISFFQNIILPCEKDGNILIDPALNKDACAFCPLYILSTYIHPAQSAVAKETKEIKICTALKFVIDREEQQRYFNSNGGNRAAKESTA